MFDGSRAFLRELGAGLAETPGLLLASRKWKPYSGNVDYRMLNVKQFGEQKAVEMDDAQRAQEQS